MLDAEQAYKCAIPYRSGGHAVRRFGTLAVRLLHAFARSGDGSGGTAYRVRLSADQIFQCLDWTFLGRCCRL